MAHPSPGSDLQDLVFVGFDTETTGLSPLASHLVELSGVKFRGDGSVLSTFSQLIDPESEIPAEATAVHGITSRMVRGKPTYREAVPAFLEWLGQDVVLVAHNASFDLGFLDVAMARLRLPTPPHPVIDTLHLCRRLLPGAPNHQLKTLTEHLGLTAGGYHRALADSYHVKDLLMRVLPLMPEGHTWKEFAKTGSVLGFTDLCVEEFDRLDVMPQGFESLKDAIDAKSTLRLVYNNGQQSKRIVTPNSVHSWKGHTYLSAFCHTSQAERTFRLDKIVSFAVQER